MPVTKNWASDSGSSKTSGGSGSSSQSSGGTAADVFDDNEATYYWYRNFEDYYWNGWVSLWAQSDFAVSHNADKLVAVVGYEVHEQATGPTYTVKAYYGGGWNTIGSGALGTSQTITLDNLGLVAVSKVRLELYVGHQHPGAPNDGWATAKAFELQSWGYLAPTVVTNDATLVDRETATLNGNISDTGGENSDERGFDYGLTDAYGSSWTEAGSFGTGTFSKGITSLNANTVYHFRAKSHNSEGWGYGSDLTFTTLPSVEEVKKMSRLVYDEMMAYMMEDY